MESGKQGCGKSCGAAVLNNTPNNRTDANVHTNDFGTSMQVALRQKPSWQRQAARCPILARSTALCYFATVRIAQCTWTTHPSLHTYLHVHAHLPGM